MSRLAQTLAALTNRPVAAIPEPTEDSVHHSLTKLATALENYSPQQLTYTDLHAVKTDLGSLRTDDCPIGETILDSDHDYIKIAKALEAHAATEDWRRTKQAQLVLRAARGLMLLDELSK